MTTNDAGDQARPRDEKQEIRRRRFVKVAERRTRLVMDKLRVLGNCANRGVYEYSAADVDKIFAALQRELEQIRHRFDERLKRRAEFKLE